MIEFNRGLEQVRKKLLDLSKRNRLINYRRPHKSKNLKFIDESPEFIYKFLVNREKSFRFKSIPYPNKMPEYLKLLDDRKECLVHLSEVEVRRVLPFVHWSPKDKFEHKNVETFSDKILAHVKLYNDKKNQLETSLTLLDEKIEEMERQENFTIESQAKALGLVVSSQMPEIELDDKNNFDIHIDEYMQTLHYADEMEKILKNIELQSRNIMNITGSNMLYLLLGVLEWREESNPNVIIKSPLITIPVSLQRMALNSKTNTYDYKLSYTGDIIETNESLSQKLFNDFNIKLPRLTEESSFNTYIKEVQKFCQHQNHWHIRQEISLDFLQFGKVLMYQDLKETQTLQEHKVLQDIFLNRNNSNEIYAPKEYDIDGESLKQEMPLVLDADSSQHSAMIDVLQGKNVVIEGPPGTGKSQIIANLIALLMYEGKKVLFVSEKLVALEVVHQRLEQVGLGDFCMELHSHKTDKVEFLKSLQKRVLGKYDSSFKYEQTKRELTSVTYQLKEYLERLHQPYGNNDKSVFDNIWLREEYLEGEKYFLFKITNAKRLTHENLLYCEEHLHEYETHYADYNLSNSFWVGFEVNELSFLENSKFFSLLSQLKEPYFEIGQMLKKFGIEEGVNEIAIVQHLEEFVEGFTPIDKSYFPFSELNTFKNLHHKLNAYLQSLLIYIDTSEINRFSTAEILDALETSTMILEELSEIESELKPEVIAFKRFIARVKVNHNEFIAIEKSNSKNLYTPMVNEKRPEDIYEIVHTIQEKRDSWFRFFSSAYSKAKKSFSLLLKEQLPEESDEWTFLLRELNLYVLNRENQLQLRLTLIEKVPMFINKIVSMNSEIKETLEVYQYIYKSSIEEGFKKLFYENSKNREQFEMIFTKKREIEQIHEALTPYGIIQESFWGDRSISFKQRGEKLQELEKNKSSLTLWVNFQRLLQKLQDLGLKEMMRSAERGEIPKDKLIEVFYFNYYNSLLNEVLLEYPLLEKFSRVKQDALVTKFQKLDKQYITQSRSHIAEKLSRNKLPPSEGQGRVGTFTNLKLLNHEIGKKTRHLPVRQLLRRAGGVIHALKPCFMMSPLSVAQYIPMEKEPTFDVLLIDEASQMKPEESLGVIARAKQVVVVGDPKQMPPSSFFDVIQEEKEESKKTLLDDTESILDTFIELYNPIRRLKWHYRSQHESLIRFSNQHFYDNELTIFPSTSSQVDERLGVKYTYVADGIYRGGNQYRVNLIEAEKVLEQVKYQMKSFPEVSLGVGTLNSTQQELIQSLVDEAEKTFSYVSLYIEKWKNNNEAFFVKNLESLQGDERDVILISTTYGKEEGKDRVAQRFGPINQESGWRRLNVLITRSKQKMHVFTSMLSSDIKTTDSSSRGVKSLKNFLKFLEHTQSIQTEEYEREKASAFVKVLYKLLTKRGYKVVKNVGVSDYRIDLAILSKQDDSYILAIECDGEEYRASNSTSDRERLKIEALKRLGWNHYRLWSMEWYKNAESEFERLVETIEFYEVYREEEKKEAIREKELLKERFTKEALEREEEKLRLEEEALKDDKDLEPFIEKKSEIKLIKVNYPPLKIDEKLLLTKAKQDLLFRLNFHELGADSYNTQEEEICLRSKIKVDELKKFNNLRLLMVPIDILEVYIDRLHIPKVKEFYINAHELSSDVAIELLTHPERNTQEDYHKSKKFPLELCYKVLEKQPSIEVFGIRYFDPMDKYEPLFALKGLMANFPQLKQVHLFYQSSSYLYEDFVTLEQPKPNEFIVTGFSDSSLLKRYVFPDFLESGTTLKTLLLPKLKSPQAIEQLLVNNRDIESFESRWAFYNKHFKNFRESLIEQESKTAKEQEKRKELTPKRRERDEALLLQLQSSKIEEVKESLKSINEPLSLFIIPTIIAMAKVHDNATIRRKAMRIVKDYGAELGEQVLKICEKKRYLSMTNEKSLRTDINKMKKVKGFNVDDFAKYMAWHHPLALGNYRFIEEESDEVETFILKRLNIENLTLLAGVNIRFLKATNIRTLSVTEVTSSVWQMIWLEHLVFDRFGKSLKIPKDLNRLCGLKSLTLYAKYIDITPAIYLDIETLSIKGCTSLLLEEGTCFTNVTTLNFLSINDDFNMEFKSLKTVFPRLKYIKSSKYAYSMKRFKREILEVFPDVKFVEGE